MVKVGDTVKLVEKYRGWCDARNFCRNGIVISVGGSYAKVIFEGNDLPFKTDYGNIKALKVVSTTPPQKITKNGYEYSLVGPVKPDWLVDGAWVVRKDNGCKHQVILNDNGRLVLTMQGTGTTILLNHHIYDQYRPHEPKDYKWGDWALYDGKRVFVVGGVDNTGRVLVSYPDIYPLGKNDADRNFLLAPSSKLTPTF